MVSRKCNINTLILVVTNLVFIFLLFDKFNENPKVEYSTVKCVTQQDFSGLTRDFFRYECKAIKRIGGLAQHIATANNPLYRIDGAWYVCFDEKFAPVKDSCNILSFGINHDYTFDEEMNSKYGCMVHSFDPFVEDQYFASIRNSKNLNQKPTLKVNDKWYFHRLGLSNETNKDVSKLKLEEMIGLKDTLKLTSLLNMPIDIVKIDIEGGEESFLRDLDIDYACKYFKQLLIETHIIEFEIAMKNINRQKSLFRDLRKLEKCFLLYLRNTRFYLGEGFGPTGYMTEFQLKSEFVFKTTYFQDEYFIANYIFSMGELYFVNKYYN